MSGAWPEQSVLRSMPISSLTCPPPVRRPQAGARPDYALLHTAIDLHESGQALESLAMTFAHLFPEHVVPDLSREPFVFVQGSSRVTALLEGDILRVRVPLVRLAPESITTAALRFVLSTISAPGQLYQPVLDGDELSLEYSDRLSRLHPYKIREVLRRMPVEADNHDDWMVMEFQCVPSERESIEELSDEEFARAWALWCSHWSEVEELVKESQRKRSGFFLNEITAYAIHHLGYALPLTGYWWARLTNAANVFNDSNQDAHQRENSLSKCVHEMKDVTAESLRASLGHARFAVSPLAEGTEKILSSNIGPEQYVDTILQLFNAGRYMESAVGLIGTYAYLLARFSWPADVETILLEGLAAVDGKPWREATSFLLKHATQVIAVASVDAAEGELDSGEEMAEVDASDEAFEETER